MLQIKSVFINFEDFPMGIDEDITLTWYAQSDKKNVILEKCRVVMYDEKRIYYDTGKVSHTDDIHISLEQAGCVSLHEYFIRVRIWDNSGGDSGWSEPAGFTTGILKEYEWKADMISAETVNDSGNSSSEYLYKEIDIKKNIKKAYACVSAWGLYELFINGRKAGDVQLAPGWTSYHRHLLYQMYDITELLNKGKNTAGILLGAGWYKGVMGPYLNRNNYGSCTAAICQIKVRYENDDEEIYITDGSWKARRGPVIFSEIYNGEIYDARKEYSGDADQEENSLKVYTCALDSKILKAQYGACVKVMEEVAVQRVFVTPKGELVADMGQNLAGRPVIRSKAWTGAEYELQCFETLDADGNVYTDNLRTARQTIIYRCKDDGEFIYTPHFTFQGFRYIHIKAWPGEMNPSDLYAQVLYSNMRRTGYFCSSNEMLNRLHRNIVWSLKSNFIDVPTDCPQRDERMGWTGDAQIFCSTACFLMGADRFYRKWLDDLKCDQKEDGRVPHVIPDIVTNTKVTGFLRQGTDSAAAWADAAVIIPWQLYLSYGDIEVLENQYPSMKKWVDFIYRHSDGAVWKYKLQFGDWVALDAEEGSYFGATSTEYVSSVYYLVSTRLLYSTAELIGKTNDYEKYRKLYTDNLKDFQKRYFNGEGKLLITTQTAAVLALYFELFPKKSRDILVDQLEGFLKEHGGHLVTGFVGTPYICFALSRNGAQKEAYELLMREDFPSWLYQIKKGATTIWEHWDGVKEDGTFWDPHMNSFNHYSYGAIGDWMYKELLGIKPDERKPGYKHFYVYPYIPEGLEFVKGSYHSRYGEIKVKWEKTGKKIRLELTVPVNTTAYVGIQNNEKIDREVGSGEYEFIYQLQ